MHEMLSFEVLISIFYDMLFDAITNTDVRM